MNNKSNVDYSLALVSSIIVICISALGIALLGFLPRKILQLDSDKNIVSYIQYNECLSDWTYVIMALVLLGLVALLFYLFCTKSHMEIVELKRQIRDLETEKNENTELKKLTKEISEIKAVLENNRIDGIGTKVNTLETNYKNLSDRLPFFPKDSEVTIKW